MVSEDKMQEEIDKATVSLGMQKELDLYSILLRIKYAKDREELIDREVKVCRAKLGHAWQIDKKILDDLQVECEKIGGIRRWKYYKDQVENWQQDRFISFG